MKKGFIAKLFASVTALTCAFSIAACSKDEPTKNDNGTNGSQTEKTEYQMLGTVTHGNLYFLSKNSEEKFDTTASLQSLIGKKVGVVQLPNVPGLILKLILRKNNVPFKQIETVDEAAEDKVVNLLAISSDNAAATIVANAENYDCFVAADPLVTLKTNQNLFRSGSLQALYGENGYPQAVIVGKSAFLKQYPEWTNKFMEKLSGADEYLAESAAAAILAPYTAAYTADGRTGSWNAKNLNAASVANCNVKFEASATCKTAVTTIVTEMFKIQGHVCRYDFGYDRTENTGRNDRVFSRRRARIDSCGTDGGRNARRYGGHMQNRQPRYDRYVCFLSGRSAVQKRGFLYSSRKYGGETARQIIGQETRACLPRKNAGRQRNGG